VNHFTTFASATLCPLLKSSLTPFVPWIQGSLVDDVKLFMRGFSAICNVQVTPSPKALNHDPAVGLPLPAPTGSLDRGSGAQGSAPFVLPPGNGDGGGGGGAGKGGTGGGAGSDGPFAGGRAAREKLKVRPNTVVEVAIPNRGSGGAVLVGEGAGVTWHRGIVRKKRHDGSYKVEFEDGTAEKRVEKRQMRAPKEGGADTSIGGGGGGAGGVRSSEDQRSSGASKPPLSQPKPKPKPKPKPADMSLPLRDWLLPLRLEAYAPILRALQCTELSQLAAMDDGQVMNLIQLAAMKENHAAKFFRNVQHLRKSAEAVAIRGSNVDANSDKANANQKLHGRQRVMHLRQLAQGALVDVLMDRADPTYAAAKAAAASSGDGSALFRRGTIGKQHKDQSYRIKYFDGKIFTHLYVVNHVLRNPPSLIRATSSPLDIRARTHTHTQAQRRSTSRSAVSIRPLAPRSLDHQTARWLIPSRWTKTIICQLLPLPQRSCVVQRVVGSVGAVEPETTTDRATTPPVQK
jgi:hypothetical protein